MQAAAATLTRRERERQERRRAMLEAARAVFAEKGYQNATLDEIAERAEFGKGTLYNYFEGGKEEILFAIFADVHDGMCRLVRDFFEAEEGHGRPVRAVFRDFIATSIRYFLKNQEVFMILMREVQRMQLSGEAEKVAYLIEQRERVIDEIEPPLRRAIGVGKLKPLPPRPIAHMIMGNIKGYLLYASPLCAGAALLDADPPSPEAAADFLATMLFDGLLA